MLLQYHAFVASAAVTAAADAFKRNNTLNVLPDADLDVSCGGKESHSWSRLSH